MKETKSVNPNLEVAPRKKLEVFLQKKYYNAFNFYFAKPVNEILNGAVNKNTIQCIEWIRYDVESEFLRRYYNKEESDIRLKNYSEYYAENILRYNPAFPLLEQKETLKKNKLRHQKHQFRFQKEQEKGKEKKNELDEHIDASPNSPEAKNKGNEKDEVFWLFEHLDQETTKERPVGLSMSSFESEEHDVYCPSFSIVSGESLGVKEMRNAKKTLEGIDNSWDFRPSIASDHSINYYSVDFDEDKRLANAFSPRKKLMKNLFSSGVEAKVIRVQTTKPDSSLNHFKKGQMVSFKSSEKLAESISPYSKTEPVTSKANHLQANAKNLTRPVSTKGISNVVSEKKDLIFGTHPKPKPLEGLEFKSLIPESQSYLENAKVPRNIRAPSSTQGTTLNQIKIGMTYAALLKERSLIHRYDQLVERQKLMVNDQYYTSKFAATSAKGKNKQKGQDGLHFQAISVKKSSDRKRMEEKKAIYLGSVRSSQKTLGSSASATNMSNQASLIHLKSLGNQDKLKGEQGRKNTSRESKKLASFGKTPNKNYEKSQDGHFEMKSRAFLPLKDPLLARERPISKNRNGKMGIDLILKQLTSSKDSSPLLRESIPNKAGTKQKNFHGEYNTFKRSQRPSEVSSNQNEMHLYEKLREKQRNFENDPNKNSTPKETSHFESNDKKIRMLTLENKEMRRETPHTKSEAALQGLPSKKETVFLLKGRDSKELLASLSKGIMTTRVFSTVNLSKETQKGIGSFSAANNGEIGKSGKQQQQIAEVYGTRSKGEKAKGRATPNQKGLTNEKYEPALAKKDGSEKQMIKNFSSSTLKGIPQKLYRISK